MMKPPTFFILILHVLCLYRGSCERILKPLLRPAKTKIMINAGESIYFECIFYIDYIYFFFPEYNDKDGQKIVFSKPEKGKSEGDGLYKYVFLRRNAKPTDTGLYGCANHNESISRKMFNNLEFSEIYFYVSSPDRLFVEENDLKSLRVKNGSPFFLPCQPTSPDLKIRLYNRNMSMEIDGLYHPQVGFLIFRYTSSSEVGIFGCETTMNGKKHSDNYYLNDVFDDIIKTNLIIDYDEPKHVIRGQNLHVNCTIEIKKNNEYILDWVTPLKSFRISKQQYANEFDEYLKVVTELTIKNVTMEDEGEYKCYFKAAKAEMERTTYIKIVDPQKKFINLISHDATTYYQLPSNREVTWHVMVYAYSEPEIKWLLPNGNEIPAGPSNTKYTISNWLSSMTLTIYPLDTSDTGVYQLQATIDGKLTKSLNFTLEVLDKPLITLKNIERYYAPGQNAYIQCDVTAFPEPSIICSFRRYPHYPSKENSSFIELQGEMEKLKPYAFLWETSMKPDVFGIIHCTACNTIGCEYASQNIFVSDGNEDLSILGPKEKLTEGDSFSIVCAASIYNYTGDIKWIKDNENVPIEDNESMTVKKEKTLFTHRSILHLLKIRKEDATDYTCIAQTADGNFKTVTYNLFVYDQRPSIFKYSSLNGKDLNIDLDKERNNTIILMCYVDGTPKPNVTWYKDDVSLNNEVNDHYAFINHNQELHINNLLEKLSGKYTCRAVNRLNTIEDYINIHIKGKEFSKELISLIVILFIVLVTLVVFFIIRVCRKKILSKKLLEVELVHFEEGALESLNPALTVDDQADLLPYNQKWEFPRERLNLGKQIGCGVFGVVTKAVAIGICANEAITTVAVKMVRCTNDPTYVRALASELKIMVHLGKHLNVVNLLGACTKNISKRELLVIVEYCRFGNLHNYLMRHRANFVNQIDPATGEFNFTIGTELTNSETEAIPNGTNNTMDPKSITMSLEDRMLCENSSQPDWSLNYRGDYKDQNLKPICTQDLLSWAFQVARGMEYLSQRKVLHGDLAARNILLAEDNVVKICDFGLAKTMYKDENYKKKGNELLPIKWMAIESIRDHVFSTQSDVWSFGIVLWEFFTLAVTPYPGMPPERQYQKLIGGYRLEQPEYSTNQVYSIMLQCWKTQPMLRPTFTELVDSISGLLEENVKAHYISLNEPYMIMNKTILKEEDDYLTMMSAPDHAAVSLRMNDCRNLPSTDNVPVSRFRSPLLMLESKDAVEVSPMLNNEVDPYLKPINVHERTTEFTPQREAANMLETDPGNNGDSGYSNASRNLHLVDLNVKQADVDVPQE